MRVCLNMDPTTVDSRKNADPCTSTLHFLIYEGLTRILPNGEGELALAKSVEISDDGKIYLFHLRDAKWSDGEPITAYDFESSWKKSVTPSFAAPCAYLLHTIKNAEESSLGAVSPDEVGISALDAKTLRVELRNRTPYFLSLITFCNFFPIPSHIEKTNPSWDLATDHTLVTSGPFCLKKWKRNSEILLEKNPLYWDAKNVHLDEITLSIIPNDQTALQMFENGELDFLSTMTTPLSMEDLAYCKETKDLRIQPMGGVLFCTFNMGKFPLNNSKIRKALSLAIDRESIVENIGQLSEKAATRCVPPVLDNAQNLSLFSPHDERLAKKLLEEGMQELGIDRRVVGEAIILSYESGELYRKLAQTIQQEWKTVLGLETKLMEFDRKTLLSRHMEKNYSVGIDRFFAQYYDPLNILERFKYKKGIKNLPGFEDPEYIRLLDLSAEVKDPEERREILHKAEAILMEEMPITPLYHFNQGVLINPEYENVTFSPLGNLRIKNVSVRD